MVWRILHHCRLLLVVGMESRQWVFWRHLVTIIHKRPTVVVTAQSAKQFAVTPNVVMDGKRLAAHTCRDYSVGDGVTRCALADLYGVGDG